MISSIGNWVSDALELVMHRLRSVSARHANRELGRRRIKWQAAYHDHALRSAENLRHVVRYVVANPVRAGLGQRVGDYPFWDGVWL